LVTERTAMIALVWSSLTCAHMGAEKLTWPTTIASRPHTLGPTQHVGTFVSKYPGDVLAGFYQNGKAREQYRKRS
jgi:hypothetical protein